MADKVQTKFGREDLIIETGKMAKQADGAVTVQYGGTVVLVTAVGAKEPKPDAGFLPLTVEYQEKTYAAGRIPGGFFKREGRPTEKEVLTARLVDRPLRPLFPKGFLNEVQIMAIVLSSDGENDPDILALIGGSSALGLSCIPHLGPVGACRVGLIEQEFILNPTYEELQKSSLDLVVAGTKEGVIMVEAGAKEVSEEIILEAIEYGHKSLQESIELQERLISSSGRPKMKLELKKVDAELLKLVKELSKLKLDEINKLSQKEQREEGLDSLCKELTDKLTAEGSKWTAEDIRQTLIEIEREEVRKLILDKQIRIDGRTYSQIRPITCEVGVLPRTHGSSLFTRGQTQSLSVTTLGTRSDEQLIEALEGETLRSFMLHYSFPPFSVGEISPIRGPGRREIGHGALAARALQPVIPSKGEFPYTLRVVSEILESNGSSSMATVCAGSLALMDAGVPIKKSVGGIAMGLVKEEKGIAILTDISGLEDHYGDMDFKVTGTQDGITALQMDIKIDGVDSGIISKVLRESNPARLFVLNKMSEALDRPRPSISTFAPRIVSLKINPDKIRDLIGPSGKTIRKIIEQTGVTIDIEDDGTVLVASTEEEASNKAVGIIKGLTEEVEVGKIYLGKVKRIAPFGAFCEILPGKEGLIHISELSDKFVNRVEDIVKLGDEVQVKVIDIDEQGRVSLSKKQVS